MEENIPVRERDNIDFSVKKVTFWGILSCVMIWLEVTSFTTRGCWSTFRDCRRSDCHFLHCRGEFCLPWIEKERSHLSYA